MNKELIPIFYTVDNNYTPYLGVSIESIKENISKNKKYIIRILHTDVTKENQEKILKYNSDNFEIEFVDFSKYIKDISKKLYTRDYYTNTTYFRLFIPNLYKDLKKAIYLDSDTILLTDIAKLYKTNVKGYLLGAIPDGVFQKEEAFQEYAEKVVGVSSYKKYFNAGVLLMNLEELRKINFKSKFFYLLETVKYSVCQDQDYLNRICKGKVKFVDSNWNVMPFNSDTHKDKNSIKLVHYNLSDKPWRYDIEYGDFFWNYAKKTDFYEGILEEKKKYPLEEKNNDIIMFEKLKELAQLESNCVGDDRK